MNAGFFIEKLRERVLESPGSRLFLTLAEELKKRGENEEAYMVLRDGIEKNPAFTAARLTLGRWYLRDGKLEEAKREFLAVTEVSPGDRFALRYLGEIEAQLPAGKVDSRRKTIDTLNRFREAIHRRFDANSLNNSRAGDR